MYFFTPDTIVNANKNIETLDSKMGGLLCILHCLTENIEENVSYRIDGEKLRKQLSMVFDKEAKDSFENAKPSYIIFAKDWVSTFFQNCIKSGVDLLSCAVFFLRRQGFEREYTKEEVIDLFIKRFNLSNLKQSWFYNGGKLELSYNQLNVEDNQSEFYVKMGYTNEFKSILFRNTIQKSATDLKAAGQIQTLYSGSGIQTCFLLSDESLDQYYVMTKLNSSCNSEEKNLTLEELADILESMYNAPEDSGKAMSPIIFGFKYANAIDTNKYSIANIISRTTLPKSYDVEIKKGMNAYRAVQKGEYGINLDVFEKENATDINEYIKFKNLLKWFVKQLNINNNLEEGNHTAGQGYKEGAGIRAYYKDWREYDGFTLDCNIVSGYQGLSSKVNYINKTDSGINIRPEFDRTTKRVVAVYIDLYNESESLYEDISALKDEKYDIEALGLFDNNLPNELLKQLFDKYREIIKEDLEKKNNSINQIKYKTQCVDEITDSDGKVIKLARNRIFFGAPGTGKSYELNEQTKKFIENDNAYYERVTFHPEYTHSSFFGTYKPVPNPRDVDKITYAFIPGPFLRVLSKALINANSDGEKKPYVLLIEEINRANVASVFGEVFQLLDREDDGKNAEFLNASKYSISPSEDVKKYLVDDFKKAGIETTTEAFSDIRIPDNMFIWASMNSADQGVFPMDTAFKRRWEFEYFGINKSEEKIKEYFFKVNEEVINWNALRKAINYRLTSLKINEDKLMGPFFMSNKVLNACTYDHSIVIKAIQNKVIMYLFEDAGRQKRKDIFVNGYEKTYSEICADFEEKGLNIFAKEIVDKYNEIK